MVIYSQGGDVFNKKVLIHLDYCSSLIGSVYNSLHLILHICTIHCTKIIIIVNKIWH